jgi:hypothetical protein
MATHLLRLLGLWLSLGLGLRLGLRLGLGLRLIRRVDGRLGVSLTLDESKDRIITQIYTSVQKCTLAIRVGVETSTEQRRVIGSVVRVAVAVRKWGQQQSASQAS